MVDGSSLLLDLDGVVVESGAETRGRQPPGAAADRPAVGGDLPAVRAASHQVEGLGAHRTA
jgi:hypothetical protein